MNFSIHLIFSLIISIFGLCILYSCSKSKKQEQIQATDNSEIKVKPPSSNQDTQYILPNSVVFYKPDSIQLLKIKSLTDQWIFEGSMHEYEFQIRNAKIVLKKDWTEIHISDDTDSRFLTFQYTNGRQKTIDLNHYNDPYGMFLYNGQKPPVLADMTNVDQALYFYFKQ
ncbi:MAG: hypothetical protein IPN15_15585 [Saprospiraceae bacterium]|nr:hypothetical protein [Candidatus Vicinibacter affinis]